MANPILIVFLPTLYIFAACLSLLQFQVVYYYVVQAIAQAKTVSALEVVSPALATLSDHFIKVFGHPQKFVPQPTHVLLVALMIAIIVHHERAKSK